MPSTYTVNLGIEKPATGEQSGTWGDTTNINFDILDQAINGAVAITLASAGTSGSPNTLAISDGAVSDGRNKWIEFVDGGDLGATAYVQLTPNDAEKIVFIRNSLSGSRSVILFQGTYDAARDLEVPAGVDMVVKFSGGGATATATDVFTRLRATAIETPSLTATTADINGGTVDGTTIGGATPAAGTFTNLTANTDLTINSTTTVDGILDEDNMASNSATKLATQQSIKAYVDSQVGTVDTLAEILANGNTSGANNLIIDNGQAITTNTINETTAGSGVTIDSVLLKDDGINATNLEITNIKANDGTAAGSIANSTGAVTITSFISNSVDIGGGAIDDTTIGGTTPNSGAFTTLTASGLATLSANLKLPSNGTLFGVGDTGLNHYSNNYLYVAGGSNGIILKGQGLTPEFAKFETNTITFNEDGGDVDFRVESNINTHALFVDGAAGHIGLGRTPSAWGTNWLGVQLSAASQYGGTWSYNGGVVYSGYNAYNDGTNWVYGANDVASLYAHGGNGSHNWYSAASGTGGNTISFTNTMTLANTGVLTNQVGAVFNESGADSDFRVESDGNSAMLFVDAGNNRVGIGTSAPTATLQIDGANVLQNAATTTLTLNATNDGSGDHIAVIDVNTNIARGSHIALTDNNGVQFGIKRDYNSGSPITRASIYTDNGITEKPVMSFDYDGVTIFNEDGYDQDFRVESDTDAHALFVDAGNSRIGLFNSSPSAPLHLIAGSSGGALSDAVQISDSTYVNIAMYSGGADGEIRIGAAGQLRGAYRAQYAGTRTAHDFHVGVQDTTGMFSIDGAGSELIINERGADTDFRVESDNNANMLTVDAGADVVLVGTSSPSSPGQEGLKVGSGWTYNSYSFTSGGSRTVTFSGEYNYQVEVTAMVTPNTGTIGQSRFIAGRRDYAGANHVHATADIVSTTADIAVSTSDSGETRTYTLTIDHGTDTANLHFMIEIKSKNVGTVTVS